MLVKLIFTFKKGIKKISNFGTAAIDPNQFIFHTVYHSRPDNCNEGVYKTAVKYAQKVFDKNFKSLTFSTSSLILGEPCYNQGNCIGYLVVKLEKNGFLAKYIHPNTLFISWEERLGYRGIEILE